MPALPQSKTLVSTSSRITNLLISLLSGGNRLETPHVLDHRALGRQPLHRGGSEEADDALGALDHVRGVVRLRDRAAVAEHDDLRVDPPRRVANLLHEAHRLVEGLRRLGPA